MTNSDKMRILWVWYFVSAAYFWVNWAGWSREFHVVFKHFENLENLILNILKQKLRIPWFVSFFSWKRCKGFTVQMATICKAMFKFWSIFRIKNLWYSFTRDNSVLQTSFQSLPGKQKNPYPSTSRKINNITVLMCMFSSILNCS